MNDIEQLTKALVKFRDDRDWEQFHNPKDLSIAISAEAGELLEVFLWNEPDKADIQKVKEELADIFSFALLLANHYRLDVKQILLDKLEINSKKYPIERAKGTSKKYNQL